MNIVRLATKQSPQTLDLLRKLKLLHNSERSTKQTVELKGKLDSILEKIEEKGNLTKELSRCQQAISESQREIQYRKRQIKAIEKKIDEATGSGSSYKQEKDKLKQLAKDGLKVEESLLDEKKVRDNYNTVTNMLKDTGIKSTIIRKYLQL